VDEWCRRERQEDVELGMESIYFVFMAVQVAWRVGGPKPGVTKRRKTSLSPLPPRPPPIAYGFSGPALRFSMRVSKLTSGRMGGAPTTGDRTITQSIPERR
jgi:hypothetical protein